MFPWSWNTERLLGMQSYVWACWKSKMAAEFELVLPSQRHLSCSAGCRRAQFLARYCSCCTPLNYLNSLRAMVFVRISMLMIHKSTAYVPQTSHRRCRSVFQHVSITLLNGCVRIVFNWMQRRPRFSGQPPVAVCISCHSHCSVLVSISLRPLPSSGTSAFSSSLTYQWGHT